MKDNNMTMNDVDKLHAMAGALKKIREIERGASGLVAETLDELVGLVTLSVAVSAESPTDTVSDFEAKVSRTMGEGMSDDNIAMGLASEAGEVVGEVLKGLYHGKDMKDVRAAILDEVGDVLWYCSALLQNNGFSLDEAFEHNTAKLHKRYPDGFVEGGGFREGDDDGKA